MLNVAPLYVPAACEKFPAVIDKFFACVIVPVYPLFIFNAAIDPLNPVSIVAFLVEVPSNVTVSDELGIPPVPVHPAPQFAAVDQLLSDPPPFQVQLPAKA